ncbi:hypothetical protein HHI36_006579, partial [Cryptolaemus montrouzieri]
MERVEKYKYLGSILTEQLDPDTEIRCRIETARNCFQITSSFGNEWSNATFGQLFCTVQRAGPS